MRVLGRQLVAPFDAFWRQFGKEISVSAEQIEEGHSSVFGSHGMDYTATELPRWASLPDDELTYHVAHELTHVLMRRRGFPKTGRGSGYPEDSFEARIGGDIEEMVQHPALEKLIRPFGFQKDKIRERLLQGINEGLPESPVPEEGTPWFFIWGIRYCDLKIELPPDDWRQVERLFCARSQRVCELGEELVAIMEDVGWGNREQALDAMIRVRNALGLGVDDRVLIIDPTSERYL